VRQQRIGAGQVVRLSRRQQKAQRIAERVDQGMDLCAQAAAAAAKRLIVYFFWERRRCAGTPGRWCCRSSRIRCWHRLRDAERRAPIPRFGPATEPPVRVLPIPEALRQVAPLYSSAISIRNRLDETRLSRAMTPTSPGLPGSRSLIRSH